MLRLKDILAPLPELTPYGICTWFATMMARPARRPLEDYALDRASDLSSPCTRWHRTSADQAAVTAGLTLPWNLGKPC